MTEPLLTALESGVTVLTVNRRLARSLRLRHDQRQSVRGLRAWPTAPATTLTEWILRMWNRLAEERDSPVFVPSEQQERVIWEQIVGDSPLGAQLLQISGTASLARDAWAIVNRWRIPLPRTADGLDHDFAAFVEWAHQYQEVLRSEGWEDLTLIPDRVAEAFRSGGLTPPARLIFAGFDDMNRQQEDLLEALRAAGCAVEKVNVAADPATPVCIRLDDETEEIAGAARWARNLLDAGATGPIGVLVPDIGQQRARVEATFSEYLQPSSMLPGAEETPRAFNISIGRPLSEAPVIATALVALELCVGAIPIARVGRLFRSPFIDGGVEELSPRAVYDFELRRRGVCDVSLALLAMPPRPHRAAAPPRLRALAEAALRACARTPREAAPSHWAAAVVDLLNAFGWPLGRSASSPEMQAVNAWWDLLADYSSLDPVLPAESLGEAVARLTQMARAKSFQPGSDEAPVQVMGLLEAGGLQFEHLWISGMHDEIIPASPSPNPFIPLRIQREHGVARSSAERELAFARVLFDGLLRASDDIIISWPGADGERTLRPSPLISGFPTRTPETLPVPEFDLFERLIHRASATEQLTDETGPPVTGAVSGGTWMIRDQAQCPFRAFARHRLHARPLESPVPGLDSRNRGTLMHLALQEVWQRLTSHSGLLSLTPAKLEAAIADSVDVALQSFEDEGRGELSPRYRELERERLRKRVAAWLEQERERAPFSVELREDSRTVQLGAIEIGVRIDRVDKLPDGRRIFIDYKTGSPTAGKWMGDRPEEPQLPIYCTTCSDVAAVLFAQIRPDKMKFIGLAADDDLVPGVRGFPGNNQATDWAGLMSSWRSVLETIARQFTDGGAQVDPTRTACEYCELGVLCRVNDGGSMDTEVNDELA